MLPLCPAEIKGTNPRLNAITVTPLGRSEAFVIPHLAYQAFLNAQKTGWVSVMGDPEDAGKVKVVSVIPSPLSSLTP